MRREVIASGVQLSAHGEVVHTSAMRTDADSKATAAAVSVAGAATPDDNATAATAACGQADTNYPMYDFPMGEEETSLCTNVAGMCAMQRPEMCAFAATQSDATVNNTAFKIGSPWFDHHPKGCFKAQCSEAANGVCFFWNNVANAPTANITGAPVCWRPKYISGTPDSMGVDATDTTGASCSNNPDYKVIANETLCKSMTDFLPGHVLAPDFLVGTQPIVNASQHLDHPAGCFFLTNSAGLNELFFNDPVAAAVAGTAVSPKGTPLCTVVIKNGGATAITGSSGKEPGKPTSAPAMLQTDA